MEGLEDDADIAAAEARQRVLVELPAVLAGHRDRAGVGALQAGHHHQQRGFARAGRTDQANRLAAAYIQVDVLEDMDAGGPLPEREIDAGKRDGRPVWEGAFMRIYRFTTPLIWEQLARVQRLARRCWPLACVLGASRWRAAAGRPVKIVALGDSLTAGFGLPAQAAFPARLAQALKAKGIAATDRQCRRLRRYRLGRARPARLVGAGGNRRGDPRTRRQ